MPRNARLKLDETDAWYHLCARAAAKHAEFPLADPLVRFKLLDLIQHYLQRFGFTTGGGIRREGQGKQTTQECCRSLCLLGRWTS